MIMNDRPMRTDAGKRFQEDRMVRKLIKEWEARKYLDIKRHHWNLRIGAGMQLPPFDVVRTAPNGKRQRFWYPETLDRFRDNGFKLG